jgi:hypothetical protein
MNKLNKILYLGLVICVLFFAACEKHELIDRGVVVEGAKMAFYQLSLKSDVDKLPVCFWLGGTKISGASLASGTRFPGREYAIVNPGTFNVLAAFPGKVKVDSIGVDTLANVKFDKDKYYNYFLYDKSTTNDTAKVFSFNKMNPVLKKVNIEFVNLVAGSGNAKLQLTKVSPKQFFTYPAVIANGVAFESNMQNAGFRIIKEDSVSTLQKYITVDLQVVDEVDNTELAKLANQAFYEGRTYMIVVYGTKAGTKKLLRFDVDGMPL